MGEEMTAVLALRDAAFFHWTGGLTRERPTRSTETATWANVEVPAPSAAASTSEPDSPKAAVPPNWFKPVVDRLRHLSGLSDGWDGPGTLRVEEAVVTRTLLVLFNVTTQNTRAPSIAPGHDGSLQLAWYVPEFDLEIDIPRSGKPSAWLYERSSGDELELPLTSAKLQTAIARLAVD
jgi:hypothetical protein